MTKILNFVLCCVIITILPGHGVVAAPTGSIQTTPAHVALDAWLTAFNSGDAKLLKAFNDSYSSDVKIEDYQKLRSTNGGFVLQRITLDDQLRIEALLKENNTGRRWRFVIELNGKKPSSIESIWLTVASAPPQK